MTVFLFRDAVANPDLVANFDPDTDQLDLQTGATNVRVKLTATSVIFTTAQGVVVLQVNAESLIHDPLGGGNIGVTAGVLAFGDNLRAMADDSLANWGEALADQASQYHGLSGADSFMGGTAADLAYGNKGDDVLSGGGGADSLYGGQGGDLILGWDASSVIITGEGLEFTIPSAVNTVSGTADHPLAAGDQLIYGNLQSDTMISGSGNDTHYGGQGNDVIVTYGGSDLVYGNRGDDWILASKAANTLYGGQGQDTIDSTDSPLNVIYGNLENDVIYGGALVYGGQGDDIIRPFGGYDSALKPPLTAHVFGNRGNDIIIGNGADILEGNAGNDHLTGSGASTLLGGDGNDVLFGTGMNDGMLRGGQGDDVIRAGVLVANDTGTGSLDIHGGSGADTIYAMGAVDGTTILTLEAHGDGGNDVLVSAHPDDPRSTWQVRNVLYGNQGSDTLIAGFSNADTLDGGAPGEADYFVWHSAAALSHWSSDTFVALGQKITIVDTMGPTITDGKTTRGDYNLILAWLRSATNTLGLHDLTRVTGFSIATTVSRNFAYYTPAGINVTGTMKDVYKGIGAVHGIRPGLAMDRVNQFEKGLDKLVFDADGVFGGVTQHIITGMNGGILSILAFTQTANGNRSDSGALIHQMTANQPLSALLALVRTDGKLTGTRVTLHGFAANGANTKLWIYSALQSNPGDGGLDAGTILYTIHIPAGVQTGDIILI